jgi:hypothetical protein
MISPGRSKESSPLSALARRRQCSRARILCIRRHPTASHLQRRLARSRSGRSSCGTSSSAQYSPSSWRGRHSARWHPTVRQLQRPRYRPRVGLPPRRLCSGKSACPRGPWSCRGSLRQRNADAALRHLSKSVHQNGIADSTKPAREKTFATIPFRRWICSAFSGRYERYTGSSFSESSGGWRGSPRSMRIVNPGVTQRRPVCMDRNVGSIMIGIICRDTPNARTATQARLTGRCSHPM